MGFCVTRSCVLRLLEGLASGFASSFWKSLLRGRTGGGEYLEGSAPAVGQLAASGNTGMICVCWQTRIAQLFPNDFLEIVGF